MKKSSILSELRNFLLLWGSQTVSALGTAMTEYALVVWVYSKQGTASSVTLLTLCIFLPTILFRFAGGALADRWDKKRIMLIADVFAACGTLTILVLHALDALEIWHLYLINTLLSFMNAIQSPASFVATSLVVPQKHYARVSGLQSFSGAAISILAPAFGSALLVFGGLKIVLLCDILTFAAAVFTLMVFIKIPNAPHAEENRREPFLKTCLDGFRWLHSHAAVLQITLFMTFINFLAKLGSDGMLSPFVLARTGGDQQVLGIVQSSVAVGLLAGSLFVTLAKPAKKQTNVIFIACALCFSGNIVLSLTRQPWLWCIGNVVSYLNAAVMGANLTTYLRQQVPLEMQGRVFSAKDTLQNGAIPLGLFLGGILADHVFEPIMSAGTPLQNLLAPLFGIGSGAGIAALFFLIGVIGIAVSLAHLTKSIYR